MPYVLPIDEISADDSHLVGDKAVSCAQLLQLGLPVPQGFVVTTKAFQAFFEKTDLEKRIREELVLYDRKNPEKLLAASQRIQHMILTTALPVSIATALFDAYEDLVRETKTPFVAVRTSLVKGDGFGKNALFLNAEGENTVGVFVKETWANLFTPQNLTKDFRKLPSKAAILIQTMVEAKVSGFLHTKDLKTNNKEVLVIEAVFGLGEILTHTSINPDRYTLLKDPLTIARRKTYPQSYQLTKKSQQTDEVKLPFSKQLKPKLSDKEIITLGSYATKIKKIHVYPQTVEWVYDGKEFFVLQTQPVFDYITTAKQSTGAESPLLPLPILAEGIPSSPGLASGVIKTCESIHTSQSGDVVLLDTSDEVDTELLKKAGAIICRESANLTTLSLFARETGIPMVSGVFEKKFQNKAVVTVDGTNGYIYSGKVDHGEVTLAYSRQEPSQKQIALAIKTQPLHTHNHTTAVQVFINPKTLTPPSVPEAEGIMALRGEMIFSQLGVHPKKLLNEKGQQQLTEAVVSVLKVVCETYDKKPVFYRVSDMNTAYAAGLPWGKNYEPYEANPVLGVRGGLRLLFNEDLFKLELDAFLEVKKEHPNLDLILPMCRSVDETERVLAILNKSKYPAGSKNHIWLTLSTPANVIGAPQLCDLPVSGFFVDLTHLATLTLGVDPLNNDSNSLFYPFDAAVIWLIKRLLTFTNEKEIPVVITGLPPSYPIPILTELVKAGVFGLSIPEYEVAATKYTLSLAEKESISSPTG